AREDDAAAGMEVEGRVPVAEGQVRFVVRLHGADVLPVAVEEVSVDVVAVNVAREDLLAEDRKSRRLNSRHVSISYAVFCLKKKGARAADGRWRPNHRARGPALLPWHGRGDLCAYCPGRGRAHPST